MMRRMKHLLLSAAFLATVGSVHAEGSYVGFGLGLQDDLGSLQNTIVVDGLDSKIGYPNRVGAASLTGCGSNLYGDCYREQQGNKQKAIISENTLIGLEKNTAGAIRSKTNGGMLGGVLSVFYENESDSGIFYRAGLQYVKKIRGGDSESTLFKGAGPFELKWYDIEWDYYSWHIPLYFGLKAGVGETVSVYGGAGLNYSWGGWNLGGTNWGDAPTTLLGQNTGLVTTTSATRVYSAANQQPDVILLPAYKEAAKFRVKSFGYQFLIGLDKKLESGNKIYFEVERILAGAQGITPVQSFGGSGALATVAVYPISLSGWNFKFGYKLAL